MSRNVPYMPGDVSFDHGNDYRDTRFPKDFLQELKKKTFFFQILALFIPDPYLKKLGIDFRANPYLKCLGKMFL